MDFLEYNRSKAKGQRPILDFLGFLRFPWILHYRNARDALLKHVRPKQKAKLGELAKGVANRDTLPNQQPHEVYINEFWIYALIMRSKMPEAEAFQDWVTEEVLPSIRKRGAYIAGQPSESSAHATGSRREEEEVRRMHEEMNALLMTIAA